MAKTLIDVDDEALARVQQLLGVATKKDAVNHALAEVIAAHERAEAVRREIERGESGAYAQLNEPTEPDPWR